MSVKRASLSGLGARLAKKPAEAAADLVEMPAAAVETANGRDRPGDGRKGILVRARPAAWKALKLIALDREVTLQDLMTEAINDVLAKHGKPPTA